MKNRCSFTDEAKTTLYSIPACKRPAKHRKKDQEFGYLYFCDYHWRTRRKKPEMRWWMRVLVRKGKGRWKEVGGGGFEFRAQLERVLHRILPREKLKRLAQKRR